MKLYSDTWTDDWYFIHETYAPIETIILILEKKYAGFEFTGSNRRAWIIGHHCCSLDKKAVKH